MGRNRTLGLKSGLFLVGALSSCGGDRDRVLPVVELSEGLEVATLGRFPETLDPNYLWTFRVLSEIRTVLEDESQPLVFEPSQVLPLSNGSLLVHDPTAEHPLVILNPATESATARFGRTGQGPGELGDWLYFAETDEGVLVVLDRVNRQVHRYSLDGAQISSERLGVDTFSGKAIRGPRGDSFLLEVFRPSDDEWHSELMRVDALSASAAFFLRLPDPPAYAEPGRIQQGRALWTVLGEAVVSMWSDRPIVQVDGPAGQPLREIHLPLTRRRITERDIDEQIQHFGGIARILRPGPAALTNELYAVSDTVFGMFTSGLWRAAEDPDLPVGKIWWRLLTIRGEYLGVLPLPEDFKVLGTGSGSLWARVLDDRGYPVIQELELTRATGAGTPSS